MKLGMAQRTLSGDVQPRKKLWQRMLPERRTSNLPQVFDDTRHYCFIDAPDPTPRSEFGRMPVGTTRGE
jgi:hypothetical protein